MISTDVQQHRDIRARLAAPPIVAILRAGSARRLPEVCEVLYGAGIRVLEFTFTTPGALDALQRTRDRLPADAALGTGSVLTAEHVDASADAGVDFMVSPITVPELLERAALRGVPYLPGAVTPTEIHTAWTGGAAAVKISPCGPIGGPAYVRAVRAPMPDVPLMPTGGIDVDEVGAYLAAGALAVGLGGSFQGDAAEPGGDLDALAQRARRALRSAGTASS
jgi:2-dehydro-3-deoxyphosphogluconate aldolase / (4S)-4-hydroxy-2-oxoglutarate aldolase